MQKPQKQKQNKEVEQYLEQLRKRVQQQIKNPFNLPFLNYSFQELACWKNAIVQLDTSSKLYSLRVDYLHEDSFKIVDNVNRIVHQEIMVGSIKPVSAISSTQNSINLHLDKKEKNIINIQSNQTNTFLWRLITDRSGNIGSLMISKLPINKDLFLMLYPQNPQNIPQIGEYQLYLEQCKHIKSNQFQIPSKIQKILTEIQQNFSLQSGSKVNKIDPSKMNIEIFLCDTNLLNTEAHQQQIVFDNDNIEIRTFNKVEQIKIMHENNIDLVNPFKIQEYVYKKLDHKNRKIDRKKKCERKIIHERTIGFNTMYESPAKTFKAQIKVFNSYIETYSIHSQETKNYHLQKTCPALIPNHWIKVNPFICQQIKSINKISQLEQLSLEMISFDHNKNSNLSMKELKQQVRKLIKETKHLLSLKQLKQKLKIKDVLNPFTALLHICSEDGRYLRDDVDKGICLL